MHIFIFNGRGRQSTCPRRPREVHPLERMYPPPLPLTTGRRVKRTRSRTWQAPGRSSSEALCPPYSSVPVLWNLPLHPCLPLLDRRSLPYVALFAAVVLALEPSLPSPDFHPGALSQSSAAHRGREKRKREGTVRRCLWRMFMHLHV